MFCRSWPKSTWTKWWLFGTLSVGILVDCVSSVLQLPSASTCAAYKMWRNGKCDWLAFVMSIARNLIRVYQKMWKLARNSCKNLYTRLCSMRAAFIHLNLWKLYCISLLESKEANIFETPLSYSKQLASLEKPAFPYSPLYRCFSIMSFSAYLQLWVVLSAAYKENKQTTNMIVYEMNNGASASPASCSSPLTATRHHQCMPDISDIRGEMETVRIRELVARSTTTTTTKGTGGSVMVAFLFIFGTCASAHTRIGTSSAKWRSPWDHLHIHTMQLLCSSVSRRFCTQSCW